MSKHGGKLPNCANCNTALENGFEFCPACGQENHDIKVPITHLGYEFLEGFTHFDTKVFNSLKYMFTKPGLITKEFLEGKRVKFVPPPRFYIFISVIFFLLLANSIDKFVTKQTNDYKANKNYVKINHGNKTFQLTTDQWMEWMQMDKMTGDSFLIINKNPISVDHMALRDSAYQKVRLAILHKSNKKGINFDVSAPDKGNADITVSDVSKQDKIKKEKEEKLYELDSIYQCEANSKTSYSDNIGLDIFSSEFSPYEMDRIKNASNEELDSILISKGESPNVFKRALLKKSDIFRGDGNYHSFIPAVTKAFSISMFFLMPIIALLTFIFFRKKRKFYVEHLIFSIHMHSFVFLVFSIFILLGLVLPSGISEYLMYFQIIGLWIYFVISINVVFENTYAKSFVKFFLISIIYMFLCTIFTIISIIYGFISF